MGNLGNKKSISPVGRFQGLQTALETYFIGIEVSQNEVEKPEICKE